VDASTPHQEQGGSGTKAVQVDKNSVDVFCVYCPDTRTCYYVDPQQANGSVLLRLSVAKNGQRKRLRWASDYTEIPKTVRGVSRRA